MFSFYPMTNERGLCSAWAGHIVSQTSVTSAVIRQGDALLPHCYLYIFEAKSTVI